MRFIKSLENAVKKAACFYLVTIAVAAAPFASAQILATENFDDISSVSDLRSLSYDSGFYWMDSTSIGLNDGKLQFVNAGVPSGGDSFSEQRFGMGGNYSELWFKYEMTIPSNYYQRLDPIDSNNNKSLLHVWAENYSSTVPAFGFNFNPDGNGNARLGVYAGIYDVTGQNQVPDVLAVDISSDRGATIEWVIHIKLSDSSPANGETNVWRNGVKVIQLRGLNPQATTNYDYFNYGYFWGWSNSGFNEKTEVGFDNLTVSTEPLYPEGSLDSKRPVSPPNFTATIVSAD